VSESTPIDLLTNPLPTPTPLSPAAAAALAAGMPSSTRRAYTGDWTRFTAWCRRTEQTARPATAETLIEYATHLAGLGRAPSTIERALAAIRTRHRAAGARLPDTVGARLVLRGYADARTQAKIHSPRRAVPTALRAMLATLDRATPIGTRDAAILLLGFATAARRSELAAVNISDLVETEDGLEVRLYRAKVHRDAPVAVAYGTNAATCPVRAVRAWHTVLIGAGRTTGPLFVRIDRHGNLAPPLVRAGRPIGDPTGRLTGQATAHIVARTASAAGLHTADAPDAPILRWSGHSLRRGFATAARRAGHDLVRIGRHGCWKDGSPVLLGYLEDADRWMDNPLIGVGL